MPSPFPGMNPFLEQDAVWQDFHLSFLPALRERIVRQASPDYIVVLEEHLYVHDTEDGSRRLIGRADVGVVARPARERQAGPAVLEAPVQVELLPADAERIPFIEIRDRKSRELVTVVELLSPSNKRPGADREQYLSRRRELLASPAHLVEIDLLRGGCPMPLVDRPAGAYSVLVSRSDQRPGAGFWPIPLRQPLPEIPIPLRRPDEAARVDLQDLLHHVYDASGYAHYLYEGTPNPPLDPDDAAWARGVMEG